MKSQKANGSASSRDRMQNLTNKVNGEKHASSKKIKNPLWYTNLI